MRLRDEMKHRILFCDGGMGSLLQARGLGAGELPETWNIKRPEVLLEVHRSYLQAGCDIINTNTFGANREKLSHCGRTVEEIVPAAVALAKEAAQGRALVALDIGPTGQLLEPTGMLDFETAVDIFAQVVKAGAAAGADLVLIETMSDLYEAKAAVLAAKEHCDLPIFVSVVLDQTGRMLTGGDLVRGLQGAECAAVLISACMLRDGETVFLDDMTLEEVSRALKKPVIPVGRRGDEVLSAILEASTWQGRW